MRTKAVITPLKATTMTRFFRLASARGCHGPSPASGLDAAASLAGRGGGQVAGRGSRPSRCKVRQCRSLSTPMPRLPKSSRSCFCSATAARAASSLSG